MCTCCFCCLFPRAAAEMMRADGVVADDEAPLVAEDGTDMEMGVQRAAPFRLPRVAVGVVMVVAMVGFVGVFAQKHQVGAAEPALEPNAASELFGHVGGGFHASHGAAHPSGHHTGSHVAVAAAAAAVGGNATVQFAAGTTPQPRNLDDPAHPEEPFNIRFHVGGLTGSEGTGSFVVRVHPDWAPHGAARIREIVTGEVWDSARFFRVVPGFVVQWGIPAEPDDAAKWHEDTIEDDPRRQDVHNVEGYVTFATAGPGTRTTQVFIDLADNSNLDSMGFPPFGRVVEGMDIVQRIYSDYGEAPDQGQIQSDGNEYLTSEFPNLSFISSITMD